ncbi:UDP-2,3-diacylglucosamine diphosphatase [Gammaproteobacteria bacterium AS21]
MTVLFISDIHLCQQRPDLTNAFVNFLQTTATSCQQLYLLGDIFDAWIGDDFTDPKMQTVFDSLQQLSAGGCQLFFQHGNRDFLIGDEFAKLTGIKILKESTIVKLPTQQALIMHGDQLCTDDVEYQNFRIMVRSQSWQQQFLAKTITERLSIAEHLRSTSQKMTKQKSSEITDVNQHAVIDALNQSGVELLIHGHTHRPQIHSIEQTNTASTRVVLGDWDTSLWYLRCDENGYELIEQAI